VGFGGTFREIPEGALNFFNPSANTTVFAKVDTTFGDDITGVGGKAGMRAVWWSTRRRRRVNQSPPPMSHP